MVTIAPERDGALEAIELLAAHGVVAAVGHTDATYEQTRAAVAAGATVGTHLFNGMRPVHHREPGPIVALLDAPNVVCELVADGVHLHDGMLAFATSTAGPDRAALITDAMAAAGMPDGEYDLGGQAVTVADGVARLARDGAIAGSTLTMDAALRHAVAAGIPIADAVRMAATTPARAIGLGDQVGRAPGRAPRRPGGARRRPERGPGDARRHLGGVTGRVAAVARAGICAAFVVGRVRLRHAAHRAR